MIPSSPDAAGATPPSTAVGESREIERNHLSPRYINARPMSRTSFSIVVNTVLRSALARSKKKEKEKEKRQRSWFDVIGKKKYFRTRQLYVKDIKDRYRYVEHEARERIHVQRTAFSSEAI